MIRQTRRVTSAIDPAVRVYVYCRLSQDKTGEAIAVERQERECRELAEYKGLTVDRVLVDNDISATSGKRRPAFEELLRIVRPGDVVVVWHTDRLVRLSRELERVLDAGIVVHAVTAGHLDLSTPAGRAVAKTVTAWAQYEGEQKAERQTSRLRELAHQGKPWWRNRPMGYETEGRGAKQVVTLHQGEAELIRQGYAWLLNGVPLREIARRWAAADYRLLNGNVPSGGDVRRVLYSPRTAGLREYRPVLRREGGRAIYGEPEIVGKGQWEPIVDEETFYAARALLADPTRRNGVSRYGRKPGYLLSALPAVTCGVCGGTLKAGGRSPQTGVPRYTCTRSRCFYIAQPWLDAVVMAWAQLLLPYHRNVSARFAGDAHSERLTELERTIQGLEAKLDDVVERWTDDKMSTDAYTRAHDRLQERLSAAIGERDSLGVAEVVDDATKRLLGLSAEELAELGMDEWRTIIGHTIGTARVLRRGKGNFRLTLDCVEVTPQRELPPAAFAETTGIVAAVAGALGSDGQPRKGLSAGLTWG